MLLTTIHSSNHPTQLLRQDCPPHPVW